MPRKKEWTKRVTVTLPRTMVMDYREIARMVGCSLSKAIRLRLEIRGSIVAVPESVMEDLKTIHELLDYVARCGFCPPLPYAAWRERVAMYDRLLDFEAETTFLKKEKKRRSPQKKKVSATSGRETTSPENSAVAHSGNGVVGC